MQQSADKRSDYSWFRPSSIPAVMYGAEVWRHTTKAVKDKMSAVVKILSQHSGPASRDCSSDVLYGDTGLPHPVYSLMLPNCVGSTDLKHGAGHGEGADSHSR
jgi:hypothetical protein